jgi:aspartate aminotransferase
MLAERMKNFSGSKTSGIRNLARKMHSEGTHVVNFAAGELDQDTSTPIKDAVRQALDAGRTQYTDTLGIAPLREQIAVRVSGRTGVAYSPDEVGFTVGAKQALFNACFVCFQPGDEVIIPAPYWVTFPEQVRLAGATPVFLETVQNDFQINVDELARLITPKTRGIILNTPHNPTGVTYSEDVLKKIAHLALKHNLICLFDECYESLVYAPATHGNIVKLVPEMKANTILIGSLSKTYCIAGWRAGMVAAPQPILKAMSNLQSHTASNACSLVQYAALTALQPENDAFVAGIRAQLQAQRAIALELIQKIPHLSCVVPSGAFYLYPDVSGLLNRSFHGQRVENVDRLAEMLLEHARIAVVSGSAFGSDRHVRISYAIPAQEIKLGLAYLACFVRLLT